MDIISSGAYPSNRLSNFARNPFLLNGIQCNSMEGFLQSLKFANRGEQIAVCRMVGVEAKHKGCSVKWSVGKNLYWKGIPIDRMSVEYDILLNMAYNEMYLQSREFKRALESTTTELTHSIGKKNKEETILTEREFCSRLNYLRDYGLLPIE